jgi:hypothetical protein
MFIKNLYIGDCTYSYFHEDQCRRYMINEGGQEGSQEGMGEGLSEYELSQIAYTQTRCVIKRTGLHIVLWPCIASPRKTAHRLDLLLHHRLVSPPSAGLADVRGVGNPIYVWRFK